MMRPLVRSIVTLLLAALAAGPALAHVTPPVVLVSDRDAVLGLLSGARRYFVREVKLASDQRQLVLKRSGWDPAEDFYRFYLGRDEQGRLAATMLFVTDYTIHGPVRVAVGLGPDGKVRGAMVVEVTEETYAWVKPLIDQNFARDYVGLDSHGRFTVQRTAGESMARFYGQVVGGLVQRATVLYDVAMPPAARS
jgi:hypothetical protein